MNTPLKFQNLHYDMITSSVSASNWFTYSSRKNIGTSNLNLRLNRIFILLTQFFLMNITSILIISQILHYKSIHHEFICRNFIFILIQPLFINYSIYTNGSQLQVNFSIHMISSLKRIWWLKSSSQL